jgi:hypothetical protein
MCLREVWQLRRHYISNFLLAQGAGFFDGLLENWPAAE